MGILACCFGLSGVVFSNVIKVIDPAIGSKKASKEGEGSAASLAACAPGGTGMAAAAAASLSGFSPSTASRMVVLPCVGPACGLSAATDRCGW